MTNQEIQEITNKAKQPCLIGFRGFNKEVQQFTCEVLNGDKCDCYQKYKEALDKYQNKETICEDCGKDDCLCGFGE